MIIFILFWVPHPLRLEQLLGAGAVVGIDSKASTLWESQVVDAEQEDLCSGTTQPKAEVHEIKDTFNTARFVAEPTTSFHV